MTRLRNIRHLLWIGILMSQPALAMSTLKQIEVKNGTDVRLIFDGIVDPNQVTVDYRNDIVQLSLNETAVYPAKITPVNGGPITKVFAYQYSPRLVRCRFTVRANDGNVAEKLKDQIQIKTDGKVLRFTIEEGPSSRGEKQKIGIEPKDTSVDSMPKTANNSKELRDDSEESTLLKKVMDSKDPKAAQERPDDENSSDQILFSQKAPEKQKKEKGKNSNFTPSIWQAVGKLALVLFCFLVFALGLKAVKSAGKSNATGILGALKRFTQGGMKSHGKVIDVLSTHYLDQKKYIAVVRVAERTLVLGVSNDSINLITQVSEDAEGDDLPSLLAGNSATATSSGASDMKATSKNYGMDFSEFLGSENGRLSRNSSSPHSRPDPSPFLTPVRSQIKTKLEGYKPL